MQDLNIIEKNILGVEPDQSVLDALSVMHNQHVHAIAILGKKISLGCPEVRYLSYEISFLDHFQ